MQAARIRALGEELDAHRKRQQAAHPGLTLTGMYNVLEKLRSGAVLTAKEKAIHEQGLVSVLRQLHDDLDAAVFAAYGWSDLSCQGSGCQGSAKTNQPEPRTLTPDPAATILTRLVALNAERAAEEARGQVRWLRPEFQARSEDRGQKSEDGGRMCRRNCNCQPRRNVPSARHRAVFPDRRRFPSKSKLFAWHLRLPPDRRRRQRWRVSSCGSRRIESWNCSTRS